MNVLADILLSLWFLVRGALDALLRRRRRRYVTSIDIAAPRQAVWDAVSASSIVFEGPPPMAFETALRPGTTDIYEGTVTVGDSVLPMAYREVEKRLHEAILIEILPEASAPSIAPGHDFFCAVALSDHRGATRLTTVHELTHDTFWGRVLVPLGGRLNARRLRTHCEAAAGTARKTPGGRIGAALLTGALTYASFMYLFDWSFAAILLAVLVIHEAGHAVAMRWVGLPVQGIYFIPFLGGVAVSAAPHRSEGERGFVALMGPGVSLLSTGIFLAAAALTGEQVFHNLALVSALLNGLNLAPVLPLDGGHVTDVLLSAADPDIATIVNILALIAGISVSLYLGWHVLTGILLLTSPIVVGAKYGSRRSEPISPAGRNWLLAGYLATVAFYVAVVAHYMA